MPRTLVAAAFCVVCAATADAQRRVSYHQPQAAPIERRQATEPASSRPADPNGYRPQGPPPNANRNAGANQGHTGQDFEGQHLGQWLSSHRGLSLDQQQTALQREPGFQRLNPEQQQRLHNRLAQFQQMTPEQQQRTIARTEAMERLAPPQRQQVRDAMAQVGRLPEYRRSAIVHAFYGLRDMPPAQRQAYLNSPQFHNQFNDQERFAIGGLLNVAPIYPPLQAQPR